MKHLEFMERIKDALKITRELELCEKMNLYTILGEVWRNGYEAGCEEAEENAKKFDY